MKKMFVITDEPIDVQEVIDKVVDRKQGAISTFIGIAREFTRGKKTLKLTYDAYIPMAEKKLAEIGDEIQKQYPDAIVAISHRIGELEISDIAVAISVSTPHRPEAFAASRYAIERIKEIVPIWKKEHWEDGEQWIGDQLETKAYPTGKPEEEDLKE